VLDVLLLLAVTRWLLEGLDDEGGSGWDDRHGCLTVLDGESDSDAESFLYSENQLVGSSSLWRYFVCAYPVTSCLCDVFSDLLWGQTKRTNLWSKRRGGADLTSGGTEVAM
jgi:hypothetical protein